MTEPGMLTHLMMTIDGLPQNRTQCGRVVRVHSSFRVTSLREAVDCQLCLRDVEHGKTDKIVEIMALVDDYGAGPTPQLRQHILETLKEAL